MPDKCDCAVEFERYTIHPGSRATDGDDVCPLAAKDGLVVTTGVVMDTAAGVDLLCGVFTKKEFSSSLRSTKE